MALFRWTILLHLYPKDNPYNQIVNLIEWCFHCHLEKVFILSSKKIFLFYRQASFQAARSGCGACSAPKFCQATKWQFVGTNSKTCNQHSDWKVLCEDMSGVQHGMNFVKSCDVTSGSMTSYTCLGIRAIESARKEGWIAMRNIRMKGIQMEWILSRAPLTLNSTAS